MRAEWGRSGTQVERTDPVGARGGEGDGAAILPVRESKDARTHGEASLQAILDTALDAIISMDQDGRIAEFNAAAERMFGYGRAEALGRALADLIIPPDLRDRHRAGLARYLATGDGPLIGQRIEVGAMRKDGSLFPVELAITRVPMEGPPLFTGYIRDITERRRAEEERMALLVREREALLQAVERSGQLEAVFESIADCVVVCDREGRLLHSNMAARRLLSLDQQPAIAKQSLDEHATRWRMRDARGELLPPDRWPLTRIVRGEVLTGAQAMDVVLRTLEGRDVDLNISGAPVRDTEGLIVGGVVVMRDVTERRRLEQAVALERDRLEQVLDVLPEAILIADATPTFILGNQAARDILGRDIVGRRLPVDAADGSPSSGARHLDGTPYPATELPTQRAALRGETVRGAQFLVADAAHGRDIPVLANSAPLRDAAGAIAGAVIAFQDITALKELEGRLQAAVRARDEFLGIAGHEMRTPLTSIMGNLQVTQRRLRRMSGREDAGAAGTGGDRGLTEAASLLERATTQVRRLSRLIDDLLDVSRIESGRLALRLERCDLAPIVGEIVHEQRDLAPTRSILLEAPDRAVYATVDAQRIGQVVTNYLTNALRYSASERPVTVGVDVEGEVARVWVRDTGPGLDAADRERVWDRFYRVEGIGRQHGSSVGLGLGLHISRTIVQQHEGQVGVESSPGAGATFWFTLPITLPPVSGML